MFTTKDSLGAVVELNNGDRIISVGGIACEQYVTDIRPIGMGMRRKARVLAPVSVLVERFLGFNAVAQVPIFDDPLTVTGQYESEKFQEWNTKDGPLIKRSAAAVVFNESDQAKPFGCFKTVLADELDGFFIAGNYTVQLFPSVYMGGDEDAGIDGDLIGDPLKVDCVLIELREQFDYDSGIAVKCGDARLVIRRNAIDMCLFKTGIIVIVGPDGVEQQYTIWNDDGIRHRQTFHDEIYLKRGKH